MRKINIFFIFIIFIKGFDFVWSGIKTDSLSVQTRLKTKEKSVISPNSSVILTGNHIIHVQVENSIEDYLGCFNIGTATGKALTYQFPESPWTSHVNVYMDGIIYGNAMLSDSPWTQMLVHTYPQLVDETIICSWIVENVIIEQKLTPIAFNDTTGAIYIQYTVKNGDVISHDVGLLLEMDTMVDSNDAAPIFARNNYCDVETKFSGDEIPDYYQAWQTNDLSNPGLIVHGTLRGWQAVCPDIFILGDWYNLKNVEWDYDPQSIRYNDSAIILRWNPVSVLPGDSISIGTYYGVGNVETSSGILSLLLSSPDVLDIVNGVLSPNPFDVNLLITNTGSIVAQDVEASIVLPAGLDISIGDNYTKSAVPSDINTGSSGIVSWRVVADVPAYDINLSITTVAQSANTDSNSISKTIFIPAIQASHDSVPIFPFTDSSQFAGDEFWLNICVGDSANPVKHLYGTSFVLHCDTALSEIVSIPDSIIIGDFLGDPSDILLYHNPRDSLWGDSLSIAITRLDPSSTVSGSGCLLRIKFRTKPDTPDTTITFTITSVAANDSALNPIMLIPKSFCLTVIGQVVIWPGDTNNDGTVNQVDLLPIGVFWNKTGYPRTGYSDLMAWEPQRCRPWPQDIRATHADANGDSIVNMNDILVIGLNWNKRHAVGKGALPWLTPFAQRGIIRAKIPDVSDRGYVDIACEVVDGDNLLGIALELQYPPDEMSIVTVHQGDFFGENSLFFHRDDVGSGKIGLSVTRTGDREGVSGSGIVASIRLKWDSENSLSQIGFGRVIGMDEMGTAFEFAVEPFYLSSEMRGDQDKPVSFRLHQNYPNPFNSMTTLRYEIPEKTPVTIKVYDLLGSEVAPLMDRAHDPGCYEVIWDGRNVLGEMVSSGIYYFSIQTEKYSSVRKGLLLK